MNAKSEPKTKTAAWNLRGVSDEARAHVKAEAEATGLSIGEWLSSRILQAAARGAGETGGDRPDIAPDNAHDPAGGAGSEESEDRIAEILRTGERHMQTRIAALQGSIEHLAGRLEKLEKAQKSGR